jgi:peptidoglycan L-alanyl-D-glutamate endopeptidase CwlK
VTILTPIMDARSEANLAQVHPDLVTVIRQAARTMPFLVIHGIRTQAEETANVAKGASQTMHSRHLPNKQGFACAIDFAALADGHITWEPKAYLPVWNAIKAAADALSIPVEWGGSWTTLKDWGHVQLPWAQYP